MNNVFCTSGILLNKKNQTLILSRKHKKYLKSYYEFPGGKVENSENFYSALVREMFEELKINVRENNLKPFQFVQYKYSKFNLIMHSFIIRRWYGNISTSKNINSKWIDIKKLSHAQLLPGNKSIISSLKDL
mgnify:CR=1 FL=1|jgi:8-oxo-dGTP diphosphatase